MLREKFLDGERFLSETERMARLLRQGMSQTVSADTLRKLAELEQIASEARYLVVRDACLQAA